MKKLTNKQILIVFGVPTILLISIVVLYIFYGVGEESTDPTTNNNVLVIPQTTGDTSYKPKTSIYEELEQQEKEKGEQVNQMNDNQFYNYESHPVTTNSLGKKDSLPINSTLENNNMAPAKAPINYVQNPSTINKNPTSVTQKTSKENPPTAPTSHEDQQGSSFGVYTAKGTKSVSADYIPAFLDKTMKLKEGSEVVFILQKQTTINGTLFEKMSVMYGIATFSGNRVNININTIRDTKGVKHPVQLIGYNENYQQGIYYEDKIDKEVNQGKQSTVAQTGQTIANMSGKAGGAVSGVITTANNMISKDNNEVTVIEGYKMFFR